MVCDTSGLLAAFDRYPRLHGAALPALEDDAGPRIVSPFVLAELEAFVLGRLGLTRRKVLTLDHRHFAAMRPLWGDAFELLPAA